MLLSAYDNVYHGYRLLPTKEMVWMLTSGTTLLEMAIVLVYLTTLICSKANNMVTFGMHA